MNLRTEARTANIPLFTFPIPHLIFLLFLAALPAWGAEKYLSPVALVADPARKCLYVAEATAASVAVVDPASGKVCRQITLPAEPGGLALSPDGAHLYVCGAVPAGEVYVIELPAGKLAARIAVGHTPLAPVVSPEGKFLYVCNRFNNNVSVIDLAAQKEIARIPAVREPVAAALTPAGDRLIIANQLPRGPADAEVVSSAVSVIDTAARRPLARIALPNGCTGLRGVCVSPDGKFAYVAHTLGRYQLPTTKLENGWMNTNALSVIDIAARRLVNTVLLDDPDLGVANPWGVACTPDGRTLCVSHAGSHELSLIDRAGLHARLDKAAAGQRVTEATTSAEEVPDDLTFLTGLRRRVKLAGKGPRGITIAGGKVYAAEYFSDSLAEVILEAEGGTGETPVPLSTREIPLGPVLPLTPARKGELYFNDAALCFQQWQSCASCHPDGRADGLNWDLLNDGINNPKNVKSMLLAHRTPPVMSLAVRDTAETAVRSGIRYIQFAIRPEEDAKAIDEYLISMKPVQSPYRLRDGSLSPAAERGKAVFEKAGCGMCHSGPVMTQLQSFDLGMGTGIDKDKPFDTPTLIEVWRTAPYLHDGRAPTIMDVLTRFNPKNRHGDTKDLTQQELGDLAEYVLSQ